MKNNNVGERIRNLRKSKKMSQEKLAEKLNVSRHSISNWEREVSYPDMHSLVEMTELFGVSLNQLVKGDEIIVNKYVYAALAFFLGGFGAHRFYRKQYGKAVLYLLFCWTGIPGVIGMVEGVIAFIKTADAQGNI
ncbi:NINE protein [Staphylococcus petrasii]|uniref:NINE protein n=1 Tax=Staphylococcus petrasii TaxID=1276936 RepID=UPI000CD082E4|nr:NINE protein [Staphylococcus petrasii]PNZ84067.1 XRE family transcriptional regulator [Staphylococcus petrasii]TGA81386.1 NINE protein [Staphylococcus petrasii]SUM58855.1 putative DNA binding protein [Staphylococcus petrasii]